MNIEARVALAKDLIRKRDEIDQQLIELFGGQLPKKPKRTNYGNTEQAALTPVQNPAPVQKAQPASALAPSPFDVLSRLAADGGGQSDL